MSFQASLLDACVVPSVVTSGGTSEAAAGGVISTSAVAAVEAISGGTSFDTEEGRLVMTEESVPDGIIVGSADRNQTLAHQHEENLRHSWMDGWMFACCFAHIFMLLPAIVHFLPRLSAHANVF